VASTLGQVAKSQRHRRWYACYTLFSIGLDTLQSSPEMPPIGSVCAISSQAVHIQPLPCCISFVLPHSPVSTKKHRDLDPWAALGGRCAVFLVHWRASQPGRFKQTRIRHGLNSSLADDSVPSEDAYKGRRSQLSFRLLQNCRSGRPREVDRGTPREKK
jgi:hypothetical protein